MDFQVWLINILQFINLIVQYIITMFTNKIECTYEPSDCGLFVDSSTRSWAVTQLYQVPKHSCCSFCSPTGRLRECDTPSSGKEWKICSGSDWRLQNDCFLGRFARWLYEAFLFPLLLGYTSYNKTLWNKGLATKNKLQHWREKCGNH